MYETYSILEHKHLVQLASMGHLEYNLLNSLKHYLYKL